LLVVNTRDSLATKLRFNSEHACTNTIQNKQRTSPIDGLVSRKTRVYTRCVWRVVELGWALAARHTMAAWSRTGTPSLDRTTAPAASLLARRKNDQPPEMTHIHTATAAHALATAAATAADSPSQQRTSPHSSGLTLTAANEPTQQRTCRGCTDQTRNKKKGIAKSKISV
jgi:hypothetical protein